MYTAQLTIERIQSLIKEKGLTQKQVLLECSINENTLKRMTDNKGISSFYLAKIADILECSVDYLLGRDMYIYQKSSPSELTENEQEMLQIFKELTPTQQGKLIERAKMMNEQNDAEAKRKDRVS